MISLSDHLCFSFSDKEESKAIKNKRDFHLDLDTVEELHYSPFNLDFGPPNLAQVTYFGRFLEDQSSGLPVSKRIVISTGHDSSKRTNGIFLFLCYALLQNKFLDDPVSVDLLLKKVSKSYPPLKKFRDCGRGDSTFELSILGLKKGIETGFYDYFTFDCRKYFHHSNPKYGNMNWVIENQLLAFATPVSKGSILEKPESFPKLLLEPIYYCELFEQMGITDVIRLNKSTYDPLEFKDHGLNHFHLYYKDGSVPSEKIIAKVFAIYRKTCLGRKQHALAIHCRAGLGRTGTICALILIKFHGFTGKNAISWLRLTRSGSILGRQQNFVMKFEEKLKKSKKSVGDFGNKGKKKKRKYFKGSHY